MTESEYELEEKCVCPNCGANMAPSTEGGEEVYICQECGCTIEGGNENFDTSGYCPSCNQPLEGNECSRCGYALGSDFE